MARHDYSIKETRRTMETLTADCDETVIIINEYPEIDYVLAYRGGKYQPWVAAWAYNGVNSWGQGHYFEELEDAIEYIRTVQGKPNWYRLDEIASKAIDGLIQDDPYEAEIYLREEIEITDEEADYFCIADTMDEEKEQYDDDDDLW